MLSIHEEHKNLTSMAVAVCGVHCTFWHYGNCKLSPVDAETFGRNSPEQLQCLGQCHHHPPPICKPHLCSWLLVSRLTLKAMLLYAPKIMCSPRKPAMTHLSCVTTCTSKASHETEKNIQQGNGVVTKMGMGRIC